MRTNANQPQAFQTFTEITAGLLTLLFAYAAISKLLEWNDFKQQLQNQVFTPGIARILLYILPASELMVVIFMLYKPWRIAGLYGSFILLILFSLYLALVMLHVFNRVPCSCGGILKNMGWETHLIFNLLFLSLNSIAIRSETT